MILEEFIPKQGSTSIVTRLFKKYLEFGLILLIFILFLGTRTYNLHSRFGFDHDQEIAANAAWNLVKEHDVSLIGIEASVGGLYSGPLLNWSHAVFLYFWNFDPISLAYQAILFSLLGLLVLFVFTKKIAGTIQAIVAAFIYATSVRIISYDISGSPISYISPQTISIIFLYYLTVYEKKKFLLPILFAILALGYHIHFALLVQIPLIILLLLKHRIKFDKKIVITTGVFFFVPFLSLILFELRNKYLMTTNFINLIFNKGGEGQFQFLNILTTFLSLLADVVVKIENVGPILPIPILLLAYFLTLKKKPSIYSDIILFMITPALFLLPYRGPLTEYYLLASAMPFIVLLSLLITNLYSKNKLIAMLIISIAFIFNFTTYKNTHNPHALQSKKSAVNYIAQKSNDQPVKLLYDVPLSQIYGFRYLLKWEGIELNEDAKKNFQIKYLTKEEAFLTIDNPQQATFGYFQVISLE